ncbi:MAG: metal ABC transporter solute-binding protein, Zn/Mn family, partial [Candidatus Nanopelagicales bacterium]
ERDGRDEGIFTGELVADELDEARPGIDWSARAATLRDELEGLDAELTTLFATIPEARRKLVTNHDSLGYLADRYGFEIVGTVVPGASTTVETNPRAFAELADLLVAERIDVIFAETTDSTTLAEALAYEAVGSGDLDVTVVPLYTGALGEPGSGAETYVGMLRTTATLITDALLG